jgi:hypothetical protein
LFHNSKILTIIIKTSALPVVNPFRAGTDRISTSPRGADVVTLITHTDKIKAALLAVVRLLVFD